MDYNRYIDFLARYKKIKAVMLKDTDKHYISDAPIIPPFLNEASKNYPIFAEIALSSLPSRGTGRPSAKDKGNVRRLLYAIAIWQKRWQYSLMKNGMSEENSKFRITNFYDGQLEISHENLKYKQVVTFKTLYNNIDDAVKTLFPYMGGVKDFKNISLSLTDKHKNPAHFESPLQEWEKTYAQILCNLSNIYALAE